MKRTIALCALLAIVVSPAIAGDARLPPAVAGNVASPSLPPVAIVEQGDMAEINRILDEQMPPRWGRPIIEFMNKIIARQQQALKPVNQPIAPPQPAAPPHSEDAPK